MSKNYKVWVMVTGIIRWLIEDIDVHIPTHSGIMVLTGMFRILAACVVILAVIWLVVACGYNG